MHELIFDFDFVHLITCLEWCLELMHFIALYFMYLYCVHDCKWRYVFDVQRVWEISTVKILLTSREIPHLHNVYTDGLLLSLLHEKPFCTILHSATHHQLRQTSKAHWLGIRKGRLIYSVILISRIFSFLMLYKRIKLYKTIYRELQFEQK